MRISTRPIEALRAPSEDVASPLASRVTASASGGWMSADAPRPVAPAAVATIAPIIIAPNAGMVCGMSSSYRSEATAERVAADRAWNAGEFISYLSHRYNAAVADANADVADRYCLSDGAGIA